MRLRLPDYIVVIVAELDRALRFYVDLLGLPLGHRSGPYAQLQTGETRLALYERQAMAATLGTGRLTAPDPDAPGFELGFKVDDVDAAYAELTAAGAAGVSAPTNRAWGQRTAYLRDPDGHLVELVTQLQRS
ncbi:MAG: VOC family protein [Actinomycetota bacterium]|nr:VOC family protein [Actinomycetota bacterium]